MKRPPIQGAARNGQYVKRRRTQVKATSRFGCSQSAGAARRLRGEVAREATHRNVDELQYQDVGLWCHDERKKCRAEKYNAAVRVIGKSGEHVRGDSGGPERGGAISSTQDVQDI